MRHVVVGELKTQYGKNLFKNLNEQSKILQAKQGELTKKHNSLARQYDELEHLKNNINEYLGRDKTNEKNGSVIDNIEKYKIEEYAKSINKKRNLRKVER